uniref:Uncharacterized protein n=1 Tax=Lactuca sativa TaxID=4236 RepID=A0A9R1UM68_LACSA|nr:hypothetical protein LSAT_V11C800398800 [Lactuca sativa]
MLQKPILHPLHIVERLTECREAPATTIVLNSNQIGDTIEDDDVWDDIDHFLAITKPIFYMIKFCDGEGPKVGEIYERMDNMMGQIKEAKCSTYFPEVRDIIVARWDKMTIPLHCLGFAFSPKYYDKNYLEKLAPGDMV